MLWTILFLLINGLLALIFLYSSRSRKRNEPPLDKGLIPWLGHALEFGKDPAKFLARMKSKHGDIFTVRVAGHYITVLLDPNSFDDVLYDTVSLDFTNYRNNLIKRIFNLELPDGNHKAERAWMEPQFQGPSLAKFSCSMNTHLHTLLLADHRDSTPGEWKQDGLFSLCYSLLFRAGYLTLFGSNDDATTVYKEFRKFDNLLSKIARRTLKQVEKKSATSAQESLWELLSPAWLGRESDETWQQGYKAFLQEEGVDAEMQRRAMLLQLWTTQGNAGPAAFWLLGFLLTHPEAMGAVKAEIRDTLQEAFAQHQPLDTLETHSTPVLDSVVHETLRLTAAVSITREVVQEKVLSMANGHKYRLRPGDRLCVFPFLSPQMDPQIHPEPQNFKYDRFLNDDMTEKMNFYKGGQKLKYPIMPWGAGSNICVGRKFAVIVMKQFVSMVLTLLDLELSDPDASLPPVNPTRYGLGVLQPDGDLQVRYRLRRTET